MDNDAAGVLAVHAGKDLHQRRLTRTVLADERVDLARAQLEMAVGKRVDAREVLADPGHLDEQRDLGRIA